VSKFLLMTDMDHVVPAHTMAAALATLPTLGRRGVLTFGRVDAPPGAWKSDDWDSFARTTRPDGSLKPHVNSFVVSRKRYWRLGGYDERLCGLYGTDRDFRQRLFGKGSVERHLENAPLIRVGRESIADASTRGVERKVAGRTAQKKLAKSIGEPKALDFPWERVL
jgi:hypothetical protein